MTDPAASPFTSDHLAQLGGKGVSIEEGILQLEMVAHLPGNRLSSGVIDVAGDPDLTGVDLQRRVPSRAAA